MLNNKSGPLSDEEKKRIANIPNRWGAITAIARELGRNIDTVNSHLRSIGRLPRTIGVWSNDEDEILRSNNTVTIKDLCRILMLKGYSRTPAAIEARRQVLRLTINPDIDGNYSANAVALGMGIRPDQVTIWIRRGWLIAVRPVGPSPHMGCAWIITPSDLRKFIIEYVTYVTLTKADKYFLVDILTGYSSQKIIQFKKNESLACNQGDENEVL